MDFISERFLAILFTIVDSKLPYALRITRPEITETFPLKNAIVTYSPKHNQVVIHFGIKTVQLHLQDWVELHSQESGSVSYMKDDVAYEFVSEAMKVVKG